MKTTKSTELTDAERKLIENFDNGTRGKEYGRINVSQYLGNNSLLKELNGTAKIIGTTYFVKAENTWYFDAIDGESFRIPEPEDGIESVFSLEFKRNNV